MIPVEWRWPGPDRPSLPAPRVTHVAAKFIFESFASIAFVLDSGGGAEKSRERGEEEIKR